DGVGAAAIESLDVIPDSQLSLCRPCRIDKRDLPTGPCRIRIPTVVDGEIAVLRNQAKGTAINNQRDDVGEQKKDPCRMPRYEGSGALSGTSASVWLGRAAPGEEFECGALAGKQARFTIEVQQFAHFRDQIRTCFLATLEQ